MDKIKRILRVLQNGEFRMEENGVEKQCHKTRVPLGGKGGGIAAWAEYSCCSRCPLFQFNEETNQLDMRCELGAEYTIDEIVEQGNRPAIIKSI